MQSEIYFAFFTYFLILLAIGLVSYKKQTSSADFIVGNRSLSFWLTALTAHASDMSAWLFMAFPAALFIQGMPGFWIAFGLILGMLCNWQFIAEPLRIATERYNSFTLSTYFERRYQDASGTIRILTACMSVVYLTIYLGTGIFAMGLLFNSLFGIDYYLGLSVATLIVTLYTFFGGFITVAWTDFSQGIFLLIVILVSAIAAYIYSPGWHAAVVAAEAKQISMNLFSNMDPYSLLTVIFLIFSWGLGYFGQPHIITKFMGIKTPSEINKAKYLGMTWQVLSLGAAGFIGLIGLSYFPLGLEKPELIFVNITKQIFNPHFFGFILCGMIAANMSTMDSQILVCASVLSEDFYKHLFNKNASPLEMLRASRVAVLLVSTVSLLIAFFAPASILDMYLYAWAGLGCSFGPLVIMSLYDSKSNRFGAISGILTGGIIAGVWPLLNPHLLNITVPTLIPGFLGGIFAIYFVSRMTGRARAIA